MNAPLATRTSATVAELLDGLFDADALAACLDRPVRPVSARVKPDTSVVLGLVRTDSGRPSGWVRVLWPSARVKAVKAADRAGRRGHRILHRELPGGLLLQAGELAADPDVAGPLRTARPRDTAELARDPANVLRYNPLRRVLVRRKDTVVRVSADPDTLGPRLLRALDAVGLPVGVPLDRGRDPHCSVRPWFGDTDLLTTGSAEGTAWAGAVLARLHAATADVLADDDLAVALHARPVGLADAAVLAEDLAALDRGLGARLARLAERLADRPALSGPPVLLHGDFSADQVLVDSAAGTRLLNDLDRAGLGAAALDLGSWLAVADGNPDEADALLRGYADGAGRVPDADELTTALASGLASRALAPLRAADPDWRTGVSANLDRLEEVLG